jgi:hypothetical protein
MPFRDYSGFNTATLQTMTAAYDAALAKLNIIKNADPRTGKIAATIAALAAEGERDPVKLCDAALAELQKKRQRRWRVPQSKLSSPPR